MKFHRFTSMGPLTNWGWYSPKEQALNQAEARVDSELKSLEDFVKSSELVRAYKARLKQIQHADDVMQQEYDPLLLELEQISVSLKHVRLSLLNSGANVPPSNKIFHNSHSADYEKELRGLEAVRARNKKGNMDPEMHAFVVAAGNRAQFTKIIASGMQVLYTVDDTGALSIGDPQSTKHSLVSGNRSVRAAGKATLIRDPRDAEYSYAQDQLVGADYVQRLLDTKCDQEGRPLSADGIEGFKANIAGRRKNAKDTLDNLKGYVPSMDDHIQIELDFDSGHYHPGAAWNEARTAWEAAGYKVQWSYMSTRV